MSGLAKRENKGLDLSGRVAAVAGGTQGIGAAVSKRLAEAGASVYVVGRNADLGNSVIEELKRVGTAPGQSFEFIKADLSLVSGIKEVASTLTSKSGSHGIDYLITSAGSTPNGKFSLTSEGHEAHFALQSLGRFGLAYLLAKKGTVKDSVLFICAPAGKSASPPDVDDLELKKAHELNKFGFLKSAAQDSGVVDAFTAHFATAFPHLRTMHTFPGLVATNLSANAGFPTPIVYLSKLAFPIISRTIGNTAQGYSEIPVYLTANVKSRDLSKFTNSWLGDVKPRWVDEKPELAKNVWDQMVQMMES